MQEEPQPCVSYVKGAALDFSHILGGTNHLLMICFCLKNKTKWKKKLWKEWRVGNMLVVLTYFSQTGEDQTIKQKSAFFSSKSQQADYVTCYYFLSCLISFLPLITPILPAQESLRGLWLQHSGPRSWRWPRGRPADGALARRLTLLPFNGEGQRRRRPSHVQEEPYDCDKSCGVTQRSNFQHHDLRLGAGRPQPETGEGHTKQIRF